MQKLVFKLVVWARPLHRKWSCSSRTLGDDMLASRCLVLNSDLIDISPYIWWQYRRRQVIDQCSLWKERPQIDRYFSLHLTTNMGDVKLSTNVVYGRNGLRFDDCSTILCLIIYSNCTFFLLWVPSFWFSDFSCVHFRTIM